MCAQPSDRLFNLKFEDIEIQEVLGGGGAGVIYKGYIRGNNQAVALKTLFDVRVCEDTRREYLNELSVLRRLSHSNIVTFLGACNSPPHLFFAMELCECSIFDKLHRNREHIPESDVIRYVVSLCLSNYTVNIIISSF